MLLFDDKMQQYPGRPSRRGVSRNTFRNEDLKKVYRRPSRRGVSRNYIISCLGHYDD